MRRVQPLLYFKTITLISVLFFLFAAAPLYAQCYGSLALYPDFFEYDYLVRYCVHFGDLSQIPEDIICSTGRDPGEDIVQVPIYCYNLHEGVSYMEFALQSNDSILSFSPQNGLTLASSSYDILEGSFRMNLKLTGSSVCGPLLAGILYILPGVSSDVTWINIVPNFNTQKMYTLDSFGDGHYAFSPQHGGYIGNSYLFTCQQPLCEEPNMPVTELSAEGGYSRNVQLTWKAGAGNYTVIRMREDRFPTGYEDGELVIATESEPGQQMSFLHLGVPDLGILYYTAYSLNVDGGGNVFQDSFVECGATDTVLVHYQIGTENSSWGKIKSLKF
ncbi:MAG: hypothetical protein JW746_06740 [Candidatus Krumholzibacteriota bacterium]|nr:hypothetical protein [Candidatus Krumholzibacteriota bacterium]